MTQCSLHAACLVIKTSHCAERQWQSSFRNASRNTTEPLVYSHTNSSMLVLLNNESERMVAVNLKQR